MENKYKVTNLKIYSYMKKSNENNLSNNALTYFQNQITYKELLVYIEKVAISLKKLGIEKGDYVPVCLPNMPQTIIIFYALNKIGAIPNMIPVLASTDEFKHYLTETPAKNFIMFRDYYSKVKNIIPKTSIKRTIIISPTTFIPKDILKKQITIKNILTSGMLDLQTNFSLKNKILTWNDIVKLSENEKNVETEAFSFYDTALLSHTGGTTGTPKSAEFINENFNAMCEEYKEVKAPFKSGEKILTVLPPFINYGLCNNIHMPLSFGIETIIVPTLDPKEASTLFKMYKPNHFMCVAHYFEYMMSDKNFDGMDLSFLKTITYGGAPFSKESEKKFNEFLYNHGALNVKICNGYGMTESTSSIAYEREKNNKFKLYPLPYTNIKIVNPETKELLPDGTPGELCVSGPTIFKGYYKNQAETEEILEQDQENIMWLHSGDIAIKAADSSIKILGRIKRIYPTMDISNGNVAKIFPDNIENILKKSQKIKECAVECKKHKERVNVPFAFVVLEENATEEEALQDLKEKSLELNNYSRPYHFIFINEIPKSSGGKVEYKQLIKLIPENYEEVIEEIDYKVNKRKVRKR